LTTTFRVLKQCMSIINRHCLEGQYPFYHIVTLGLFVKVYFDN